MPCPKLTGRQKKHMMNKPEADNAPATVSGNIVDVIQGTVYPGTLKIRGGRIADIRRGEGKGDVFIIPGLIDSHVHVESSMLVPSEFARLAVRHGTVATVSDPHEIANVLGTRGIDFMIENGRQTVFKFFFGVSSCVPATAFETAGAEIWLKEMEELFGRDEIKYLGEMMDFPGVLHDDPIVLSKLALAKRYERMVDGHAPGLRGEQLRKYIGAGITTDHETVEYEEGREKIENGMKLQIREGSAARNFDSLVGLLDEYPDSCMFCSDDKHPDDLVSGHINDLVKRALQRGIDRMKVLRAASLNPIRHYGLEVGLLRKGDPADFAVIDNFRDFTVLQTWINGRLVADGGKTLLPRIPAERINNFRTGTKIPADFGVKKSGGRIHVIEAVDGQLITRRLLESPCEQDGHVVAEVSRDILKLAVVNRYRTTPPPAVGFIRSFGLKRGAIAASEAHDSHNIIAVGTTDEEICNAVNLVIGHKGGIAAVDGAVKKILPLPVAGLMSDGDGFEVARNYSEIDRFAKGLGSTMRAPFMTLSFMALLVIPEIKLSDRGLFDGLKFDFMPLFEE